MNKQEYLNIIRARNERLDNIALELGVWYETTGEHLDIAMDNQETDNEILKLLHDN